MTKALLIPVEGPVVELELSANSTERLRQLQEGVGGWIEAVSLPSFIPRANRATAYVNEEGKLEGLPINRRATDFMVPGVGLMWGDYIAGPFIVVGFDPSSGDETDVPESIIRRVRLIEREAGS